MKTEWIGVNEIADEMKYTRRQTWEYLRKIGIFAANATTMRLARFTRAEFDEARERAKSTLPPKQPYRSAVAPVPTPGAGTRKGRDLDSEYKRNMDALRGRGNRK